MSVGQEPVKVPMYGAICEMCGYPLRGMLVFSNGKLLVHQDRQVIDHRLGVIPDRPAQPQPTPTTAAAPVLARTA